MDIVRRMNILGISYNYHDAAACLVRDGVPIAAAEEERFTRRKHDSRFPEQAIKYCLAEGGMEPSELECVVFYEKPAQKLERLLQIGKAFMPASAADVAKKFPKIVKEGLRVSHQLRQRVDFDGKVYFCEHHMSHAASAFFASPFDDAAVLTVDGVGEWSTCTQFVGHGQRLEKLREIHYPDSLGLLYSTLTAFLGFQVNDDEYKVMGLAAYGQPRFKPQIEEFITLFEDGGFALNLAYFSYMYDSHAMYAEAMTELLGPPRRRDEPIDQRHRDIAASLQAVTQDAMVGLARSCRKITGQRNLCLAGGLAYNCVANSQVVGRCGFDQVFIQPAAGDNGAALGAALWAYHEVYNMPRGHRGYHTLLGPQFTDEEILLSLDKFGLKSVRLSDDELCRRTARLVYENLIIGWFQGRMEFGPRALGNRSIIANPCSPDMRDILNNRVKLREDFRPFAPAVVAEAAATYFELDGPSPFMLLAPRVRPERAAQIPSVTHIDGTARVQTVSREQNPLFYRLLECFGEVSGVPMVINTSFNIRGEPIVCSPADAVMCFLGTDIDFLVIGNFLVSKA